MNQVYLQRNQKGGAILGVIFLILLLFVAIAASGGFLYHKYLLDKLGDGIKTAGLSIHFRYDSARISLIESQVVFTNPVITIPGGVIRGDSMTVKGLQIGQRYTIDNLPEEIDISLVGGNLSAGVLGYYFPELISSVLHYANIPLAPGIPFTLSLKGQFQQDRAGNADMSFDVTMPTVGHMIGIVEFKGVYPQRMRNSIKSGINKARIRYRDKTMVMGFVNHVMAHNAITDQREAQKKIISTLYEDAAIIYQDLGIDVADTPRSLALMLTQGGGIDLAVEFFTPYFFQSMREYRMMGENFEGTIVSARHMP